MSKSEPEGYLAVPPSGVGPGVLVLHAWWGLNDTIENVCDQLAAAGYLAYAPDLYHGKSATEIEGAELLSEQLDSQQAMSDIADAVDRLSDLVTVPEVGIGVIGFSLGAFFALKLSVEDPARVRSVVLFYGTGSEDFSSSKAAYQGHFAEVDPYEPAEHVDQLESAIKAASRPVEFFHYDDAGHWFFEPDRPDDHNKRAAQLAWERTLAFLNENLFRSPATNPAA